MLNQQKIEELDKLGSKFVELKNSSLKDNSSLKEFDKYKKEVDDKLKEYS